MNYYGYNGESANVKTGFQYLRARYYYAENGTFTTEDSDLGTKENPLTRNRYSYVMNNPLNYADPTGHRAKAASGIGRAGAIVKSIGNIVKTVTNVVKAAAGVAMAVGSIHAQVAQTGGTKGQTRGAYQSGYVPSGKSKGGLSYIQYMSKIVVQQMRVVLCTNQEVRINGEDKINNQRTSDIAKKQFGLLGNIGDNGCGAIAIYNADQILGRGTDFDDIVKGFNDQKNKYPFNPTLLGGLMGGNPLYIQKYYVDKGYSAIWRTDIENISKDADAYISLVVYKGSEEGHIPTGAHYQAGEYIKTIDGEKLQVYNGKREYTDFLDMYQRDKKFETKR